MFCLRLQVRDTKHVPSLARYLLVVEKKAHYCDNFRVRGSCAIRFVVNRPIKPFTLFSWTRDPASHANNSDYQPTPCMLLRGT